MRPKILLVDDVRLFLEIEKSFFRHEDVEIFTANGGLEALVQARSVRPDLIILDLHMPDVDGDECCRQIKADPDLLDIPVLLVTASDHPEALERCQRSGAEAVITKPLTRENFLQTGRRFLAGHPVASPRVPARIPVRYGIDAENALRHHSFNIGRGGLFLETPIALPRETVVTLELELPDNGAPIACNGRIAWVNAAGQKVNPDLPPGLGIQFLDLATTEVARLQGYLRTLAQR